MSTVLKQVAAANLSTRFGDFRIFIYTESNGREHTVLATNRPPLCPLVRIHSQCLTGDTFLSLKCDCQEQLHKSLELIASEGGYLLYLNQEGRGIGLANKIRAYALQERGLDTVSANEALGFQPDEREYAVAVKILLALKIKKIILLTNNPDKECQLLRHGVTVVGTRQLETKPHQFNRRYLQTKKRKLGHRLKLV